MHIEKYAIERRLLPSLEKSKQSGKRLLQFCTGTVMLLQMAKRLRWVVKKIKFIKMDFTGCKF